ncbi:MAG: prepilin-type N-terminal cleavage/methylation domain-containing protein [Candidatus Pacebacteria bacterium]|nr:prepilin-type N-terminal cleavage/methylation domain-containing protein [Candidatus Paceibacterota bacterium]
MWNKQYSKGGRACEVKQGHVWFFGVRTAHRSSTRGVTLVEMLVAFAIMSVSFVIVLDAFISSNRAAQVAQRRAEVTDALSYALADMAREAQVSTQFTRVPFTNTFEMQRLNTIADIAGEKVLYTSNNFQLVKTVGLGVGIPITPDSIQITGIQLIEDPTADSKKVMRVIITARHRDREGLEEPDVILQTTFAER